MAWKDMGPATKAAVGAIVVILFGLGGYQLSQRGAKAPEADKVAGEGTGEATAGTEAAATSTGEAAKPAEAAGTEAAGTETAPAATSAPAATESAAAEPATAGAAATTSETATSETTTAGTTTEGAATDSAAAASASTESAPATGTTTESTSTESAATESTSTESAATESAATESATTAATATAAAPAAPAAAPPEGSFDVVRIDPDGQTLVAGHVAAGALVRIFLDETPVADATAGADGNFVAMFALPPGGAGRLMNMYTIAPDGSVTHVGGSVAIAETTAPQVAAAEPAAPGATTPDAAPPDAAPQTGTSAVAVTDQGAKVLQAPDAGVSDNVTLETITYPTPESVQFGGRGTPGGFVRLYLDNAPLGEPAAITADGAWNLTQQGIAPGVHTLRADQLDAGGKVTSRYETPFKRETVEALAQVAAAAQAAAAQSAAQPVAPATEAAATETQTTETQTTETQSMGAQTTEAQPVAPQASASDSQAAEPTPTADATKAAPATEQSAEPQVAATEAPAQSAEPAPKAPVTITVQPGYTLWGIATREMGSGYLYVQVWQANKDKIRDPDLIYPGQVFTMPAP